MSFRKKSKPGDEAEVAYFDLLKPKVNEKLPQAQILSDVIGSISAWFATRSTLHHRCLCQNLIRPTAIGLFQRLIYRVLMVIKSTKTFTAHNTLLIKPLFSGVVYAASIAKGVVRVCESAH